ncbi:MAG: hypothetical protein SFU53_02525 [Terrimicrobiaceae bacterium]|nr:hypothetical protein [Terrimicrobiaceae bacterium]
MKTHDLILLLALALAPISLRAGESKRTAEYILATASDHEGQSVALDVAFVKPVHWKSPIPELAFFHAATSDTRDNKPGGVILVAVAAADVDRTIRKYGMDHDGRGESDTLRGTLLVGPGPIHRPKIYFVDTTGQAEELIKKHRNVVLDPDDGQRHPRGPRGFGGASEQQGETPAAD